MSIGRPQRDATGPAPGTPPPGPGAISIPQGPLHGGGLIPPDDPAPAGAPRAPSSFEMALETLVNRHGVEKESDTPDYLLAQYLRGCLDAFNTTVRARDHWYGFQPWPLRGQVQGTP